MSMKRLWGPLLGLFLLPALYSVQRPAERLETALPPVYDSMPRQTGAPAETALVFPDYVDGGGWSVQLVLSNIDPDAAAEAVVEVYDQGGRPILDLFDSESRLEIPPLGSRVLRSAGVGAVRRGWIEVETDSVSVSGSLTYRDTQSGIEVGVKPVELGEQFALFVEESPTVGAGVAIFKPDATSGIDLRLRDEEGADPLEGVMVSWDEDEFQQAARTLPEWFTVEGIDTEFLSDFRGLLFLETEDDSPFAPLGLRFGKRTSSLSAVPAIRTHSQEPRETDLVFPDYVDGDGWSVQLVLSNIDPDAAAEAVVDVYDPDGGPILDLFDSEPALEIPPRGSRILKSSGVGPIRRGWVQVQSPSASISGLLTYRQARTGIEVSVEPAALGTQFALFVEESEAIGAGLAIFKPEASPSVEFRLRDEAGDDPLGNVYVPWRNFHQWARTLPEWLDVADVDTEFLRDFRGLLFLRSEDDSPFVPLGLRFGKRGESLSAVPAIRLPEGGGIDGGQAPPPAVTLSALPTAIDRGQSTTLTWSSTNAESAEITPGIGEVPTSGSRQVSPNVTTTYRITVTGADGQTATESVTVTVAVSERVALGVLFEALGGTGWAHSDNWLTDAPLGDWYGVEVDSQGRVIELRLIEETETPEGRRRKTGIGLTGEIPPELASLSYLRVLDLSRNRLTGKIPPELGQLSQLQLLDLGENQLTGEIPPELGRLSQLQRLELAENRLTGEIPPELGSLASLSRLQLPGNTLKGPIPTELGSLSNLEWLNLGENNLTGPIPPELGSLVNLSFLYLGENNLTGPIPTELGSLVNLRELFLYANNLTGPIPASLLRLDQLTYFLFDRNQSLCVPGTSDFVSWLRGIDAHRGPSCNESDLIALDFLYRATGGTDWTNSGGWLGDDAVSEWYGISADSLGRVTAIALSDNNLDGRLSGSLGQLSRLTKLRVDGNNLRGRLPLGLTRLPLQEFHYADTDLCAPVEESFQVWLNAISSHDGTGAKCAPLTDRDILVSLYDVTGGPNWIENANWLTNAPLEDWSGVATHGRVRVIGLDLNQNNLTGSIPPELGNLSRLEFLKLKDNQLTDEIPPELGQLSRLHELNLWKNQLKGEIPPELGQLSRLQ